MPKERSLGFIILDLSPEDIRLGFITSDLLPCFLWYFLLESHSHCFLDLSPRIYHQRTYVLDLSPWIYHHEYVHHGRIYYSGFITRGHTIYPLGFITLDLLPSQRLLDLLPGIYYQRTYVLDLSPWIYYQPTLWFLECGFITLDLSPEDIRHGFITSDLLPCSHQELICGFITQDLLPGDIRSIPLDLSPWIYYHCGFITLDLSPEDVRLGFITFDLLPLPIGTLWIYHLGFITRGHTSWIYHLGFITTFPVPCPQDLPISEELPKITGILAFFWLFLSLLGIFGHFCCHNSSLSTRDSHPHQFKDTLPRRRDGQRQCRKTSLGFHPLFYNQR